MNDLVQIEPIGGASFGIKGCTYIYAPRGQALEYAPLASNPYRGCGCNCLYCYVPGTTKQPREEFNAGAKPRADFLKHLAKDARKYQAAGITEQVFFCFTTDMYNPFDRSLTRPSLELVQEHGMGICVLTKGGSRALDDIDLYRPDRDCFASTLTTLDDAFSKKWESRAALPDERIATLKAFHERGIFTWVSLEPTLDVESSLAIVEATHGFVDLYKIGRANYLQAITRNTNWRDYTVRMIDVCQRLGVKHYIKKDLQPYLPVDYFNPLRVQQYHDPAESLPEKNFLKTPEISDTFGSNEPKIAEPKSPDQTKAEFRAIEKQVDDKVDELTDEFKALMRRFDGELLPLVDRAQEYLSIRGSMHVPGIGLPSWADWRDSFLKKLNKKMNMSLSTLKRRLKEFREEFGYEEPRLTDEAEEYEEEEESEDQLAIYESPKELLTKRLKELHTVLSEGTSPADANPLRDGERRISDALELVESTQLAIEDGLLNVIAGEPAQPMPTRPEITGEPVAEPDPNTLEDFRRQLFRIPDTRDMSQVPLKAYLNDLAARLMEGHPLAPQCHVSVQFGRAESTKYWGNIVGGDWLEYKGGNARVTKQLGGKEISLGRVVEFDMRNRPRVRWYNGSEWLKPYSLFQEGRQVNVLFDYQAAEVYPDAFSSYPKEKGKKAPKAKA